MGNPLTKLAQAGILWISAVVGVYVTFPLVDTVIGSLPGISPVIVGIAWIAYIILAVVAVIILPVAIITSPDA